MIVEKIQNFLCVAAKKIFLCVHIFIVVMILLEFGRLAGDVFPLHYQLLNALLALLGLTAIFLLFFICCTRKIAGCVCKKNRVVMFCIFYAVIIFVMQMYLFLYDVGCRYTAVGSRCCDTWWNNSGLDQPKRRFVFSELF